MFRSLLDTFDLLRDQVWFFRFFIVIGVVCVYRTLLHFVLRTNHCANPFCSKCVNSNTVRGRAISHVKNSDDYEKENSLSSIILGNLLEHDRLCRKSEEKPTVYFHRGLSSSVSKLPDQDILIDHYDEIRQEIVKFFQDNDNIQWKNFYLFQSGQEKKANCEKFPKLFEILHLLPSAICIHNQSCFFGSCFLTRLSSDNNEEEKSQSGFSNCSIRMHFGLMCNDESPAFAVLNKRKRLPIENKRAVIYNDAIEHSIDNPNKKQQVFLTVDFWHPDLSPEMRQQLGSTFRTDLL